MPKTMRIKTDLLMEGMTLIMPDGKAQRVTGVASEAVDSDVLLVDVASSKTATSRRIKLRTRDYIQISSRIPAHVRGEVLYVTGVTGEWMYAEEHADKPRRYRFTWIPRTTQRYSGYGDCALTYGQLRNMSDFVLTCGVPQPE